jgi:hypothetical protein
VDKSHPTQQVLVAVMPFSLTTIQGTTTAQFGVDLYLVDASSGPITITLPDTTIQSGNAMKFKRVDWVSSNAVTIVPNEGSVIDGNLVSLALHPSTFTEMFVDSDENWQRTLLDLSSNFAFGDGGDGVVAISADTTLTRDMYYKQLNVSSGARIATNGFRVFVQDRLTLTGNGSGFRNDGAAAVGSTGGAGAGGTTPGNLVGSVGGGFRGSNGVTGLLVGGSDGLPNVAQPGSIGGVGGAGGSAGLIDGGVAGVNTPPGISYGGTGCVGQQQNAITARDYGSMSLSGGSSGGSGAANSLTATSGGGGGSGGIVVICARSLICDSDQKCTISATGGNGGNAAGTGVAGGGGGGGGGGVIVLTRVPNVFTNCPGLTISVNGGTGGSGIGGANNGANGAAGILKIIDSI